MKPKHLISPFTRANSQIMIEDRVWYVPPQCIGYSSFTFPGWNHPLLFDNAHPVSIEYCSGNGAWVESRAKQNPNENWIAVEKKFDRVRKIWSKIKNGNLQNLLAVCGEGNNVTQHYFPTASVKNIYINFPDPWPKARHAKHRIIQPTFIREVERILQIGGSLTFVTDDINYSTRMIDTITLSSKLHSQFPAPYYVTDYPSYGSSYFEEMWRQKGKAIRYHIYKKTEHNS